jgi:hypothetical protein
MNSSKVCVRIKPTVGAERVLYGPAALREAQRLMAAGRLASVRIQWPRTPRASSLRRQAVPPTSRRPLEAADTSYTERFMRAPRPLLMSERHFPLRSFPSKEVDR